jgi:hypothetical protein
MTSDSGKHRGFKASELLSLFTSLKEEKKTNWWKDHVLLEFSNARAHTKSNMWISVKCRLSVNDFYNRFNIIVLDEIHSGQIMPNKLEDVAELKEKYPHSKIEMRMMKPSIQIRKYTVQIKTQEDGITPIVDENGNPILPDEKFVSKYYRVVEFMDEIYKSELNERIDRFVTLKMNIMQNKNIKDTVECVTELRKEINHIIDGDTIIQENDVRSLKDKFPVNFNVLTKGFVKVNSNKVISFIQEYISEKAQINKGKKLCNPITRITLSFETNSGPHQLRLLDKDKPYRCDGQIGFDEAKVDNVKVNDDNVHKFITTRSVIDGIICMDSICISQMGISLPIRATTIIVRKPNKNDNSSISICNDIYDFSLDTLNEYKDIPETVTEKKPTANSSIEITDSLLNDLQNS